MVTFFHNQSNKTTSEELAHSFLEDDSGGEDTEDLRSVEGTSLLHVMFAVRQDQALGREFVKYLKVIKTAIVAISHFPSNETFVYDILHYYRGTKMKMFMT